MKLHIPSLREAFGQEPDPKVGHLGREPEPQLKHPGQAMPSGIGAGPKKSQSTADAAAAWLAAKRSGMNVTGQTPAVPAGTVKKPTELPPTPKQSIWQQTQDFLKQRGSGGMAGVKPGKPGSKPGSIDMTAVPDEIKPKFKGNMIGQTFTTAGKTDKPNVAWQEKDPETGEVSQRYGRGQERQTKHELVWNGQDWVTKDQFSAQFGKKKV